MGSRATRQRGFWIVLVGPDGVGKTTVATALMQQYGGASGYFHFLPPVFNRLSPAPDSGPVPTTVKAAPARWRVLGWARLLRNAARGWLAYLTTIGPALRRGTLVVGDRWMYGYIVQPAALRFYGPPAVARLIIGLLPRPDLVVNLAAPAPVIHARKQELGTAAIERELGAWSELRVPSLTTTDATRPPDVLAKEILVTLSARRTPDAAPCASRG